MGETVIRFGSRLVGKVLCASWRESLAHVE